jgi:hypothetical protein
MKNLLIPVLALVCLHALSCAKRGMPDGGPADQTAPYVDFITPSSGATEVAVDSDVRITFSEPMKKRTVETGVVVSPSMRWRKRYWEGATYILVPEEPLVPRTTYLVSVTNKAEDTHGLKMKSTFVGGFSTGVSIDAGRIAGMVTWKQIKVNDAAVVVFDADTLALGTRFPAVKPVYVTLTGEGGLYEVPFVDTTRTYWVLAFMDKNSNAEYDEEEITGCFGGRVDFKAGGERTGVDVILCRETLCGSVKGSVDSLTLSLYPQVGLEAASTTDSLLSYETICDRQGRFSIDCMDPGTYSVGFYADTDSNSTITAADSLFYRVEPPVEVKPCHVMLLSPPPASPGAGALPDTSGGEAGEGD